MSKFEEYSAKAEASLAAAEVAKSDKERAFHRNAHTIWRKLLRGLSDDGERPPTPEPAAKPKAAKALAKPAPMKTVTLSNR